MFAGFLSVVSPLDFGVIGSILKTRMAWWPLLMLLSFTSSMSGNEFIAQRKLAFHVFGSGSWPVVYFPAQWILFSIKSFFSLLSFAKFACMWMHACTPVWIAQDLNRQASFSTSQPWRAACFQGIVNVVLSCRTQTGILRWSQDFLHICQEQNDTAKDFPLHLNHVKMCMQETVVVVTGGEKKKNISKADTHSYCSWAA